MEPTTIAAAILGAIGTGIGFSVAAIGELVKHPIISFALIIGLLTIDAGTNIIGTLVTGFISFLGIPFQISSLELAILGVLLPICILALKRSVQINAR